MIARQLVNPLVLLLTLACVLAAWHGDTVEATAIGAIVALNALLGGSMEWRAEKALERLQALTAPVARVRRDGEWISLPARELVAGDWIALEAGHVVPADGVVASSTGLLVREAILTGEPFPVEKTASPLLDPRAAPEHCVAQGTAVVRGMAQVLVTATGPRSRLGHIATLVAQARRPPTPLQGQLRRLARGLGIGALLLVAVVATVRTWHGESWRSIAWDAVALAVAAVPEGLSAIVTLALAHGVRRLAQVHVLVRRLDALDTLGGVTVICTDKTGTLTTGELVVRETWADDADALAWAADAATEVDAAGRRTDPLDQALHQWAMDRSPHAVEGVSNTPPLVTHPFDPETRQTRVDRADGWTYAKGAFESIDPLCSPDPRGRDAHDTFAGGGQRVIAVARWPTSHPERAEFLGLVGLFDPPREGAVEAVAQARHAGIVPVLITGDHASTARAIAADFGLPLRSAEGLPTLHARASPADKLQIVRTWQSRGAVVAMTGDGVNDAPALSEAHVGVAMGRTGTQVARDCADIVLTDDNFSSLVAGIREGRSIRDDLRKAVAYLVTGNLAELLLMLWAAVLGLPVPLLPVQLLWVNLVTDGAPALALAADPATDELLDRPPVAPEAPLIGRPQALEMGAVALLESLLLLAGYQHWRAEWGLDAARTLVWTTLVGMELVRAPSARSDRDAPWRLVGYPNRPLRIALALSAALHALLCLSPWGRQVFHVAPVPARSWGEALALTLLPALMIEASKMTRRWLGPGTPLKIRDGGGPPHRPATRRIPS